MMVKMVVNVCDECGEQEGVVTYELKRKGAKGRPMERDLCVQHNASIEELMGLDRPKPTTTKTPAAKKAVAKRPSRGKSRVTTIEEIEKLKGK